MRAFRWLGVWGGRLVSPSAARHPCVCLLSGSVPKGQPAKLARGRTGCSVVSCRCVMQTVSRGFVRYSLIGGGLCYCSYAGDGTHGNVA